MKIGPKFSSFNISAKGMSVQKRKMDIVAENIANSGTTKTEDGSVYKRKYLNITSKDKFGNQTQIPEASLKLKMRDSDHMEFTSPGNIEKKPTTLNGHIVKDETPGEMVYMPEHPDANTEGYVEMPNINVVNEMVDMIAATRNYEANLTAFNAAKQMAKDSLEI